MTFKIRFFNANVWQRRSRICHSIFMFIGTPCTWFLYENAPQPGLVGHSVPDFYMRIHPSLVYWDTLYLIFIWESTPAWFIGTPCTWFLCENPPQAWFIGTPCTWFLYVNPPQAWDQEQTDAIRDINKIPIFCLLVFMLYLKVVFAVKRDIWVCIFSLLKSK